VILGDTVVVTFTTTGWTWEIPTGQPNAPDTGHMHFIIDGQLGIWTTGDSIVLTNLQQGSHTVTLELQNNDHSDLSPAVEAEVHFETTAGPAQEIELGSVMLYLLVSLVVTVITLIGALYLIARRR
jgi:hypothetical protein